MTILDTNVISELMKIVPSPAVLAWTGTHAPEDLFISTISMAEILLESNYFLKASGVMVCCRKLKQHLQKISPSRILPFDEQAARAFGPIFAARRRQGRPMGLADAQIASIAMARGAVLASRNTGDFEDCGLNWSIPGSRSLDFTQQILGNCSPLSMSTTRLPPMRLCRITVRPGALFHFAYPD